MFGPSPSATGGIANGVKNLIENGIGEITQFKYISTIEHSGAGHYFSKLCDGFSAYFKMMIASRHPIDIVHIKMSSYMSFFRKWVIFKFFKWKKTKTIIQIHGSEFELFYNNSNSFVKKIIEDIFNAADGVLVLSLFWKKFVQKISNNSNIYIFYNGVSLQKFAGKTSHVDYINVLFMGRLGKRKGTYDLLEAFEKAIKRIPNFRLILGGDGEVDQIKKIVSRRGITGNVVVPGWISGEEKIRLYKNCDIFVLPSYNEGLPNSILEAMAVGVPIISTPVGGIPEAVIENVNGFLILPGNVESLFDKLVLLGEDKKLREKMGDQSQLIIKEKFDIEKAVTRLGEIYDDVMKR